MAVSAYVIVASLMFLIGAVGAISRKNTIVMFMCIELMLNAANIILIAGSNLTSNLQGQAMVVFVMAVAAAEASIGLAIVIALFRNTKSVESDKAGRLKW